MVARENEEGNGNRWSTWPCQEAEGWWWSAGGPEAATTELETADAGEGSVSHFFFSPNACWPSTASRQPGQTKPTAARNRQVTTCGLGAEVASGRALTRGPSNRNFEETDLGSPTRLFYSFSRPLWKTHAELPIGRRLTFSTLKEGREIS